MGQQLRQTCPACGGRLRIRALTCGDCDTRVEGDIPMPHLCRLEPDLREFAELYLLAGGSLKAIASQLGVSYPLVRNRLDRVIEALQYMREEARSARLQILDDLEAGRLRPEEAARLLRQSPDLAPDRSTAAP